RGLSRRRAPLGDQKLALAGALCGRRAARLRASGDHAVTRFPGGGDLFSAGRVDQPTRAPGAPMTSMRVAFLLALQALPVIAPCDRACAGGQEGHWSGAEIGERRLSPPAAATVARTLGRGTSLASVASWADDVREKRPETTRWHFVDIPIGESTY